VEYNLEVSKPDQIQLVSSDRLEQSAVPLSMAWYPPITKESLILTVNSQVHYSSLHFLILSAVGITVPLVNE